MASFARVVDGGDDEEAPWPSEEREARLGAKLQKGYAPPEDVAAIARL